jgi:hypothetical protein
MYRIYENIDSGWDSLIVIYEILSVFEGYFYNTVQVYDVSTVLRLINGVFECSGWK